MKTVVITILVLAVLVGGYFLFFKDSTTKEMGDTNSGDQAKIDVNTVCEGALAYMTFPSGEASAKFVEECKNGEHPEVIDRYKADMHLDGAAI